MCWCDLKLYNIVYGFYIQQIDIIDASKKPTHNNTTYRLMNYSTTTNGYSRPKQANKHVRMSLDSSRKDPCLGKETYEVRRPIIGGLFRVVKPWKNKQNPLDIEESLGFLNSQLPTSSIWISSPWKNRYAMHFLSFNLDPPVSQVLACSSFRRHVRDVQFFVQCWPRGSSGRTTTVHWSGQN